jgi:hypothetical protein
VEAQAYGGAVLSGNCNVGKWVKAECQRQQDDLKRWAKKRSPFFFDPVRAERVCRFIENLTHVKGPLAVTDAALAS